MATKCKPLISAAELTRLVTIRQRTAGQDALGAPNGAWADLAQVWAKPEPLRGREYFAAGQMQQTVEVRFTVRWRADITASMQLVCEGVPYDIVAAIDVKLAHEVLELMCVSGVRDGR